MWKLIYGEARYFPFQGDQETVPLGGLSFDQKSAEAANDNLADEIVNEEKEYEQKLGNRDAPQFYCFWKGRLVPGTTIATLPFVKIPKSDKQFIKRVRRVQGRLFFSNQFDINPLKYNMNDDLSAILNQPEENGQKVKFHILPGPNLPQSNRASRQHDTPIKKVQSDFKSWLEACSAKYDQEVEFRGASGKDAKYDYFKSMKVGLGETTPEFKIGDYVMSIGDDAKRCFGIIKTPMDKQYAFRSPIINKESDESGHRSSGDVFVRLLPEDRVEYEPQWRAIEKFVKAKPLEDIKREYKLWESHFHNSLWPKSLHFKYFGSREMYAANSSMGEEEIPIATDLDINAGEQNISLAGYEFPAVSIELKTGLNATIIKFARLDHMPSKSLFSLQQVWEHGQDLDHMTVKKDYTCHPNKGEYWFDNIRFVDAGFHRIIITVLRTVKSKNQKYEKTYPLNDSLLRKEFLFRILPDLDQMKLIPIPNQNIFWHMGNELAGIEEQYQLKCEDLTGNVVTVGSIADVMSSKLDQNFQFSELHETVFPGHVFQIPKDGFNLFLQIRFASKNSPNSVSMYVTPLKITEVGVVNEKMRPTKLDFKLPEFKLSSLQGGEVINFTNTEPLSVTIVPGYAAKLTLRKPLSPPDPPQVIPNGGMIPDIKVQLVDDCGRRGCDPHGIKFLTLSAVNYPPAGIAHPFQKIKVQFSDNNQARITNRKLTYLDDQVFYNSGSFRLQVCLDVEVGKRGPVNVSPLFMCFDIIPSRFPTRVAALLSVPIKQEIFNGSTINVYQLKPGAEVSAQINFLDRSGSSIQVLPSIVKQLKLCAFGKWIDWDGKNTSSINVKIQAPNYSGDPNKWDITCVLFDEQRKAISIENEPCWTQIAVGDPHHYLLKVEENIFVCGEAVRDKVKVYVCDENGIIIPVTSSAGCPFFEIQISEHGALSGDWDFKNAVFSEGAFTFPAGIISGDSTMRFYKMSLSIVKQENMFSWFVEPVSFSLKPGKVRKIEWSVTDNLSSSSLIVSGLTNEAKSTAGSHFIINSHSSLNMVLTLFDASNNILDWPKNFTPKIECTTNIKLNYSSRDRTWSNSKKHKSLNSLTCLIAPNSSDECSISLKVGEFFLCLPIKARALNRVVGICFLDGDRKFDVGSSFPAVKIQLLTEDKQLLTVTENGQSLLAQIDRHFDIRLSVIYPDQRCIDDILCQGDQSSTFSFDTSGIEKLTAQGSYVLKVVYTEKRREHLSHDLPLVSGEVRFSVTPGRPAGLIVRKVNDSRHISHLTFSNFVSHNVEVVVVDEYENVLPLVYANIGMRVLADFKIVSVGKSEDLSSLIKYDTSAQPGLFANIRINSTFFTIDRCDFRLEFFCSLESRALRSCYVMCVYSNDDKNRAVIDGYKDTEHMINENILAAKKQLSSAAQDKKVKDREKNKLLKELQELQELVAQPLKFCELTVLIEECTKRADILRRQSDEEEELLAAKGIGINSQQFIRREGYYGVVGNLAMIKDKLKDAELNRIMTFVLKDFLNCHVVRGGSPAEVELKKQDLLYICTDSALSHVPQPKLPAVLDDSNRPIQVNFLIDLLALKPCDPELKKDVCRAIFAFILTDSVVVETRSLGECLQRHYAREQKICPTIFTLDGYRMDPIFHNFKIPQLNSELKMAVAPAKMAEAELQLEVKSVAEQLLQVENDISLLDESLGRNKRNLDLLKSASSELKQMVQDMENNPISSADSSQRLQFLQNFRTKYLSPQPSCSVSSETAMPANGTPSLRRPRPSNDDTISSSAAFIPKRHKMDTE